MMREPRSVGYSPLATVIALVIVAAIAAYAAPLVNITKPADKEIVSGIADIEVTYTSDSDSPVVRLEVYIDGQPAKDFRLTDPKLQGQQSFRWDFTLATPSTHSISARAMDASGAVGATGIKVMVQRRPQQAPTQPGDDRTPPTVDIYYPAEGQVVSGELRVKADVSDNVGVRTVVFFLDGEFKTMIINSPNYSDRIDTQRLPDGPHVVSASAWDLSDNEGKSDERTFIVRNREATAPGSGQDRIARAAPKPPAPSSPTLEPPSVPELAVGHEAPPVTGPTEAAPGPMGVAEPETPAPDSTPATSPDATVGETPRPAGGEGVATQPSSASAALPTETFGSPGEPRTSSPSQAPAARPTPPSPKASDSPAALRTGPTTSGMVASLPTLADSRPASPDDGVPVSSPLTGPGRPIAARPSLATPAATVVEVATLTNESAVRTAAPSDGISAPKTGTASRVKPVILASPDPRLSHEAQPLGDLRQERVAVLPTREAEDKPRGKLGQPASLDVESMARFRDVKIVFNGQLLSLRTAPVVLEGVSMTPLREVFEHTDGVLYWFHVEKRVRAVNPDTELELKIGRPTANVNGNEEGLVLAPFIKNGRTMVPLDFVARTLDVTLSFNSDTGELIISSNKF